MVRLFTRYDTGETDAGNLCVTTVTYESAQITSATLQYAKMGILIKNTHTN